MAFPSTLSTFARPATTDKLNNPSHSALHNTVSSALGQVEAVLGVTGASSVVGTINTTLFSPGSDGGGHVQSANKGGTGQTSYTKGDILVATSASALTKLAVGTDTQILQANPSTASGINWVDNTFPKVLVSGKTSIFSETQEASIFSITIPGSTLGTSNAIKTRLFINNIITDGTATLQIKSHYGSTSVATIVYSSIGSGVSHNGVLDWTLVADNSVTSQKGMMKSWVINSSGVTSFVGNNSYRFGPTYADSAAPQTLGMTAKWDGSGGGISMTIDGYTVEKIR